MNMEIKHQVVMGVHSIVKWSDIPNNVTILLDFRQLRRNWNIKTSEVKE